MAEEIEVTTVDGVPIPDDVPRLGGMPMLGYGTWRLSDPEECVEAVSTAIDVGYRHLDTAQMYGNETAIGDAIDRSHVDRDEIFLASKVWYDSLAYEDAIETAYRSLDRLGTDYLDLLYVHWPAGEYDPETTLDAFDQLVEEGVTERIGVSNFEPDQLTEACERTSAPVFANQFECHPLLGQRRLREACGDHDVYPVAYAPLARTEVMGIPAVADVAAKHDRSPAQVSLAWLRQKGITAIPKATGDHIHENWQSLTLRLDDADVRKLDSIDRIERQVDPSFGPWNRRR